MPYSWSALDKNSRSVDFVLGFPGGSENLRIDSACQCRRHRFKPWVRKIPWGKKWQPTPIVLPGKFHGQRRLVRYSPWGHKELGTIERLSTHRFFSEEAFHIFPCIIHILIPPYPYQCSPLKTRMFSHSSPLARGQSFH